MREDLGPVIRTIDGKRLDPVGDALVDVSTHRARHLTVRPIAHERVDEDELLRAGNGRTMLPSDELLSLECMQHLLEPPRVDAGEARDRVGPEHFPEDGSELQELFFLAREGIDPSDDDPLQGLGSCRGSFGSARQHPCVLLCEERVALGPRQERGLLIGGEYRSTQQPGKQARGVRVGQRDERDGCRVALSASPAGAPIKELGSSRADDKERDAGHPIGQRVDEVE